MGLAAADKDNAKAYIEATAIGLPLYVRHGWQPVQVMRVDLDSFGFIGEGVRVHTLMVREPRGGRGGYDGNEGGRD